MIMSVLHCMCTACMCGACKGQNWVLDPLDLAFTDGTKMQVLWKSSKYS